MMADVAENPGVEELYESATNTSNLKHEADKRTPADVLRDMAMSANRLGAGLLRLRAQWESTVQPERQQPRSVKKLIDIYCDKEKALEAHHAERAELYASYRRMLIALASRLPDLESVRNELLPVALKRGWGKPVDPITRSERTEQHEQDDKMLEGLRAEVAAADDASKMMAQATLNHWLVEVARTRAEEGREDAARAREKIGAVILYWLDQTCPRCEGTKWQLVPGTNRQSTKVCPQPSHGGCGGTGYVQAPGGQEGRWLANYMDQCSHRYQQKRNARRQALASIPPIDRLSKRSQAVARGSRYIDPEAD